MFLRAGAAAGIVYFRRNVLVKHPPPQKKKQPVISFLSHHPCCPLLWFLLLFHFHHLCSQSQIQNLLSGFPDSDVTMCLQKKNASHQTFTTLFWGGKERCFSSILNQQPIWTTAKKQGFSPPSSLASPHRCSSRLWVNSSDCRTDSEPDLCSMRCPLQCQLLHT